MIEIIGNLWDYYKAPGVIICITTNGTIKNNGAGIMGRGCAKEALDRIPGLDIILGSHIREYGNRVNFLSPGIIMFPVKHHWWEKADLELISRSAQQLSELAEEYRSKKFILPRPGCGNGRLNWKEVKSVVENLPDNIGVISR